MPKSTGTCRTCKGGGLVPSCGGTCPGPGHDARTCLPVPCPDCPMGER
jgi:hypothetical protein